MFKIKPIKFMFAIFALSATFSASYAEIHAEAFYGFNVANLVDKDGKEIGEYVHSFNIRPMYLGEEYVHELMFHINFLPKTRKKKYETLFSSWKGEYRLGTRLDKDMAGLDMIYGNAYLGLGYEQVSLQNVAAKNKVNIHIIYLPFGFWGIDGTDVSNLTVRYGLGLRFDLFTNIKEVKKIAWDFGFGGKAYLGIGYMLGLNTAEIFAQAFYQYNEPLSKMHVFGLELGLFF